MTTSSQIRQLSTEGTSVAEIARMLGIRYQHAYNVVNAKSNRVTRVPQNVAAGKPAISSERLLLSGFVRSGQWTLNEHGVLAFEGSAPRESGVYAFAHHGIVHYVGVATVGLAKRLYFYARPGPKQLTNIRINALIKSELVGGATVEVLTAQPDDRVWNGLPVDGSAGLELGIIRAYALPWNIRSSG